MIQQGDITIASSSNGYLLLKDSDNFGNIFGYLSFQQGWSRCNNWSESTLYGNNNIEPYNHKLLEYFVEDKRNLSKKMNAAMIHDEL